MKRPKLPKGVHFIDEEGRGVKEKEAWDEMCKSKEIFVRISVRGIPRQFHYVRGEVSPVIFAKKLDLDDRTKFEDEFEYEVDDFVYAAIWWAKETQRSKERRAIVWRRLRSFPESNRVMSPVRFKRGAGQSRLF